MWIKVEANPAGRLHGIKTYSGVFISGCGSEYIIMVSKAIIPWMKSIILESKWDRDHNIRIRIKIDRIKIKILRIKLVSGILAGTQNQNHQTHNGNPRIKLESKFLAELWIRIKIMRITIKIMFGIKISSIKIRSDWNQDQFRPPPPPGASDVLCETDSFARKNKV